MWISGTTGIVILPAFLSAGRSLVGGALSAKAKLEKAGKSTSGDEEDAMPNASVRAAAEGLPKINKAIPHPATDLSFMRLRVPRGTGIDYWIVESTGSYGADYDKGLALGQEFLDYIGKHPTIGNETLIGCIVNDMLVRRTSDRCGLELGFFRAVCRYAMATARAINDAKGDLNVCSRRQGKGDPR